MSEAEHWSAARSALIDEVLSGRAPALSVRLIRPALAMLSGVYTVGLEAYLLPYLLGVRRKARLGRPVISVGNLTTGGTGKTPLTRLLCNLLVSAGQAPVVLSRGYKGRHEGGAQVVSTRSSVVLSAEDAGDEAHMLASSLPGVPVLVGKDRRVTGRLAVEQHGATCVVLDDGMQFYQLHRDLDVVLIDAERPFDNGWTFPRGRLREPPSHLRRAGCVVITGARRAQPAALQRTMELAARYASDAVIVTADYEAMSLRKPSGELAPPTALAGRPVATITGLGNPAGFEHLVRSTGMTVRMTNRFPDHHRFTTDELVQAAGRAERVGAESLVTSEKDAVRMPTGVGSVPVYTLLAHLHVEPSSVLERALGKVVDMHMGTGLE